MKSYMTLAKVTHNSNFNALAGDDVGVFVRDYVNTTTRECGLSIEIVDGPRLVKLVVPQAEVASFKSQVNRACKYLKEYENMNMKWKF